MRNFNFSAFADEYSPVFDEQLSELNALGINMIEPRGVDGLNISKLTPKEAEIYRAKLEAANISISAIGSPAGKVKLCDFEAHFNEYKNTLQVADILGANKLRGFSFYITDKKADRECVLRCLELMIKEAQKHGILYCHENEKGIYADGLTSCLDLFSVFGKDLGCVFDPANFIQCGTEPKSAFDALYPYITYMHIKDADKNGTVCAAGEGIGEIPYMLGKLADSKRRITLTLEPHLKVFEGLTALEGGDRSKLQTVFRTNKEAFEYAYNALYILTDVYK